MLVMRLGNDAVQQSFKVTIIDDVDPVISSHLDQNLNTDPGKNTASLDVTTVGTVTDNSGTVTTTYMTGSTVLTGPYDFPIGVTTVTVDAVDGTGNMAAQQSFTVTVSDAEIPVITPPTTQIVNTDEGVNSATLDVTSLGSVCG